MNINTMKNCNNGRLADLSERLKLNEEVSNPIQEFEATFEKWHTHVIVMIWEWNHESKEPYVFLTPLSVCDNLNRMAQIVIKVLSNTQEDGDMVDVDFIGGNELHFSLVDGSDEPDTKTIVTCEFVDFNSNDGVHGGWKFDLPKQV